MDGFSKEPGGRRIYFQIVLRILERRFRHAHVNPGHWLSQKPRLLEFSLILHLRGDSIFTKEPAELRGFFRLIEGSESNPDIRDVRTEW